MSAVWLLFAFMMPTQANQPVQDITVRLVDIRNEHAMANERLNVQFHLPQVPDLQSVEIKTAADGIAKFHLPQPAPENIAVFLANLDQMYPCSSTLPLNLEKIIHDGLASRCSRPPQACRCDFSKISQVHSEPGELVLFARPVTKWERFRSYIWE